jgi:steroid delta-isomerase-like uncharacterized protein
MTVTDRANGAALLRRWFEVVWNERREDLMEELAAPDVLVHGSSGPKDLLRGLGVFREMYRKLLGTFPDIRFTVEEAIGEGDVAAVRWTARMTHTGDDLGFPATQKTLEITGMTFARFKDGKTVEAWDNWDMLGLMNAIGQTPHTTVVPLQTA